MTLYIQTPNSVPHVTCVIEAESPTEEAERAKEEKR